MNVVPPAMSARLQLSLSPDEGVIRVIMDTRSRRA
jgi:hypothetical protein